MKKNSNLNFDYIRQIIELPILFTLSFRKSRTIRNPKKILIINTCLIGDIVSSLHAMNQYIKHRKNAQIDVMVPSHSKSIVERLKGINKIYIAKSVSNRKDETMNLTDEQLKEIMANQYDLILVMRISREAYSLMRKLKTSDIKVSFLSYMTYIFHLIKNIVWKGKVKQYREMNFKLVGEEIQNKKFEEIFNFTTEDYKQIAKMPVMAGKSKKIIIHAGKGWKKGWENWKWAELLRRINKLGNFKFIFIGNDKKEEADFKNIQSNLNFKIYSLIKKVNLSELFLIMRKSDYFIGIDSGPRNMAHLADLRSVSLLGPGPKHFMPLDEKDVVIDKSDCRCTHLFCFKKKTCMQKITVEDVFEGFKRLKALKR
ncbi:MAG: glycosyltransferase family 9 protein [Nanoarchaeota archaeon]